MKPTAADLAPAHINGLKSGIHALEVQITILKGLLGGKPGKKAKPSDEDETDEDETDEDETDEDETDEDETDEDETDEDETDEDETDEDETDEDETGPTKQDVIKALAAHSKKHKGREHGMAILAKFKVKNVNKLDKSKYAKVIKLAKGPSIAD